MKTVREVSLNSPAAPSTVAHSTVDCTQHGRLSHSTVDCHSTVTMQLQPGGAIATALAACLAVTPLHIAQQSALAEPPSAEAQASLKRGFKAASQGFLGQADTLLTDSMCVAADRTLSLALLRSEVGPLVSQSRVAKDQAAARRAGGAVQDPSDCAAAAGSRRRVAR